VSPLGDRVGRLREGAACCAALVAAAPASLAHSAAQDGYCDHKRLKEIHGIVEDFEKAAATAAAAAQRLVTKIGSRAAAQKAGSEHSDGGESISRTENSALSWLADAGMILRDPPVLHLLLHETVRATCAARLRDAFDTRRASAVGAHARGRGRA
jgi:hypothetical protein